MFFKSAVCCGLTVLSLGCAKRDAPATKPIDIQLQGDGTCLSTIGTQFRAFTNNAMSSVEVNGFWNCMSQSIQDFQRLTIGDMPGGAYSPDSIRQFIEHYFMSDSSMNDGMLAGLMEVKRVFLGGTNTQVKPSELATLVQLIAQFRAITLTLQPSAGVIFRDTTGASEVQVQQASAALKSATTQLSTWLMAQNQSLPIASLETLIDSVGTYENANGGASKTLVYVQTAIHLLPDVKSILIGGDPGVIAGQEWGAVCNAIDVAVVAYLAVANGFDQNLDVALNRITLPQTLAPALAALSQSAARHSAGQISLAEFSQLFTDVAATGWLPSEVTAGAMNSIWQWALMRLLGDGSTPATGLSVAQIATLQQSLTDWQNLYGLPATDTSPLVQAFNAIVNASPAANWDGQGRLLFPQNLGGAWPTASRNHLIWEYVVVNLVKTAYAGGGATYITPDQVSAAAGEILPLLQNFGWLRSTQVTIGTRLLREADLFTWASNGDGNLDMFEAVRYVAFIASSYRSAQVWLAASTTLCGSDSPACVHQLGSQAGSGVIANMPALAVAATQWTPAQFTTYMQNAETTILGAPESGTFTTGDLLQTIQLMGYVETFVERFDLNPQDGLIEIGEAETAYQLYGPTLSRLFNGALSPADTEAFFTFMMKYGDTPFDPNLFGGQILFNNWRWNPTTWQTAADRNILMSILSQLSKL